jgi:PAS domain S-box-containing protein
MKPAAENLPATLLPGHLALLQEPELRAELVNVLESMTDGFVALDSDWRIIYVNAAAEKTNGRTRESLLGKTHWEAFPAVLGTNFEHQLRRAMSERVPLKGEDFYEPDGRWFEYDIHPFLDGGLAFYGRDVTERRRAQERERRLQSERDQSLARLQLQFDRMPIACILFDQDRRILEWNPAAEAIFGYRRDEVTGKDGFLVLLPPAGRVQAKVIVDRLISGDMTAHSINENMTKDGRSIICEWHNTPLQDADGQVIALLSMAQDITERKRAEEALQDSEECLATDLAAMTRLQEVSTRLVPAGDTTPLLLEIVDAAIAITGADMGNIQLLDRDCGALKIVASRGFERPFLEFFAAVEGGEAACGTAARLGSRVVIEDVSTSLVFEGKPAREVVLAAGVRAVQSTPLVSRSGRPVGMLSTHYHSPQRPSDQDLRALDLLARQAADWIERTQAEEAVRQSEQRYRSLISQVKDFAIFATDEHGLVSSWNEGCQHVLGYAQREFLGLDIAELYSPDDRDAGIPGAEFETAVRLGTVSHARWMMAKGGRRFFALGSTAGRRDSAGALIGFSTVVRDLTQMRLSQDQLADHGESLKRLITERTDQLEKTTERLRVSERLASLGTLAAGLGHDMGNLILPLDVRLEQLLGADLPPDLREHVVGIQKCTQYLKRLSTGLRMLAIDPSSRTAERTELNTWWQDIGVMLEDVLPRGVRLEHHLPDAPCWVAIGRVGVTQAVLNLVQNAADAMRERGSGRVSISAKDDPDTASVILQVQDEGPGMSEEVIRHCLEPYFSTKERGESTGMGLAFVHGLTTGAGGRVELDSMIGRGTTVSLILPRAVSA